MNSYHIPLILQPRLTLADTGSLPYHAHMNPLLPMILAAFNLGVISVAPALTARLSAGCGAHYRLILLMSAGLILTVIVARILHRGREPHVIPVLLASGGLATLTAGLGVCDNELWHLLQYGLLGWLSGAARFSSPFTGLILALGTGLADECIQGILPGRVFEMRDLTMNGCAALSGILLGSLSVPYRARPAAVPAPRRDSPDRSRGAAR